MKLLTVLAEMAVVAMLVTSVGCAITADDPQDSSPARDRGDRGAGGQGRCS